MRNSTPQSGEGRYVELHDGSLLLRERDRERLNDRLAWLPEAERVRILEEAWLKGPEVYDQIDDAGGNEITQIWQLRIESRIQRTLKVLKLEGIRTLTSELAQECIDEVLAVVDELRGVVRRHLRAFLIAGGLAVGASATWTALNSDLNPVPVAHASEQAPDQGNCDRP